MSALLQTLIFDFGERLMIRNFLIPIMTLLLVFSCTKKSQGLKEDDVRSVIGEFLYMHVNKNQLSDELSEKTLDNYIKALDPGKYYFYKSDIDTFNKHKYLFDDYISSSNYEPIFQIYNTFLERYNESFILSLKLLDVKHDFSIDEDITIDREKTAYAVDKKEMEERWRKRVKLQILNYITIGKDIKYAQKYLKKKYTWFHNKVKKANKDDILARFVNAFAASLDPHSSYLSMEETEDFKISMELKLEGIGARLRQQDGFTTVESIIKGGPADMLPEKLQLKPNDKIIAVAQDDEEAEDVIELELSEVVKKIRGKKGTRVILTILRDTPSSKTPERKIIPIIRDRINLEDSAAKLEIKEFNHHSRKAKIAYINLPSFYLNEERTTSSSSDMMNFVNKSIEEKVDGMIVDLRGNPGGLLNESVNIAGLFLGERPVVQIKAPNHFAQTLSFSESMIGNDYRKYNGPLVILVDGFSASASEILAGAVKDYQRGIVIGPTNTFGKGTVQSYNELPYGSMKVTTHLFYQPGGTSNQLNGISPHIVVPSLTSIWDIGEDKLPDPLKWEPIGSQLRSRDTSQVNTYILSRLRTLSTSRLSKDSEYLELRRKIQKYKEQLSQKTMSLKKEADNVRKNQEKLNDEVRDSGEQDGKVDLKKDLFLREAFKITADYIEIVNKK